MKIILTLIFILTLSIAHSQCPVECDYVSENNSRQVIIKNKIKTISNLKIGFGCYPAILDKESYLKYDSITHSKTYYNTKGYVDSSYIRDYDNSNNITKTYIKYLFDKKTGNLLKTITTTKRIDQYGFKIGSAQESNYIYDKNSNRILSIHGDTTTDAVTFKYSYDLKNKIKSVDVTFYKNGGKELCQHYEYTESESNKLKVGAFSHTELNTVYKTMREFDEQMYPIALAKFNVYGFLTEQSYTYKKYKDLYCYEYY